MLTFAPEVVFLWTLKMWCVSTGIAQLNDLSQCSVQTTNSRVQTPGHVPKKAGGFFGQTHLQIRQKRWPKTKANFDVLCNNIKQPALKQTTLPRQPQIISTWRVFEILDHLRPTATGLDLLPAWFLHVGAPFFCEPVARLFNLDTRQILPPAHYNSHIPRPSVCNRGNKSQVAT